MIKYVILYFLKIEQLELPSAYKCIKHDLPQTSTWVFSRNEKTGILKFEMSEKDKVDGFLEGFSGFTAASSGDSGSPYWTSSDLNGKNENRATLVAIHNARIISEYSDKVVGIVDSYNQCVSRATKMTSEILAWAKQKSGISN